MDSHRIQIDGNEKKDDKIASESITYPSAMKILNVTLSNIIIYLNYKI